LVDIRTALAARRGVSGQADGQMNVQIIAIKNEEKFVDFVLDPLVDELRQNGGVHRRARGNLLS
jgi:hypothetical protein